MATIAFAGPIGFDHEVPAGHPERPDRLRAVMTGLTRAGLDGALVPVADRAATRTELASVHSPTLINAIEELAEAGGGAIDGDTWAGPHSFEAASRAVGALLAVVDAVSAGADIGFAAVRPPGHHATSDQSMGFCLFNAVAVAGRQLTQRGERVMIIDFDVHHGNGTEEIFFDDPDVCYVSTHQAPLYPGTGQLTMVGRGDAEGTTVNIPLPAGTTGDIMRRAYEDTVVPIAEWFSPTWVLVSAGFDAHRADPLASMDLTAGDFADLAALCVRLVPPSRCVFALEGGYDLDALQLSVGAALSAAIGGNYRPEPSTTGGAGRAQVDAAQRFHLDQVPRR